MPSNWSQTKPKIATQLVYFLYLKGNPVAQVSYLGQHKHFAPSVTEQVGGKIKKIFIHEISCRKRTSNTSAGLYQNIITPTLAQFHNQGEEIYQTIFASQIDQVGAGIKPGCITILLSSSHNQHGTIYLKQRGPRFKTSISIEHNSNRLH
jgi:hypothetical protein